MLVIIHSSLLCQKTLKPEKNIPAVVNKKLSNGFLLNHLTIQALYLNLMVDLSNWG